MGDIWAAEEALAAEMKKEKLAASRARTQERSDKALAAAAAKRDSRKGKLDPRTRAKAKAARKAALRELQPRVNRPALAAQSPRACGRRPCASRAAGHTKRFHVGSKLTAAAIDETAEVPMAATVFLDPGDFEVWQRRQAKACATPDDARPRRGHAPLCTARRTVPPQAPCLRHELGASEPVSTCSIRRKTGTHRSGLL